MRSVGRRRRHSIARPSALGCRLDRSVATSARARTDESADASAARTSSLWVYSCCGSAQDLSAGPGLDDSPRCITASWSARSAARPRSWVISTTDVPHLAR